MCSLKVVRYKAKFFVSEFVISGVNCICMYIHTFEYVSVCVCIVYHVWVYVCVNTSMYIAMYISSGSY